MVLNDIKGGLIVSCQALPDEPLYSDFIMSRMARAAVEGGAVGIRANSIIDIKRIKAEIDKPIIGIIKKEYENSDVYITPTKKEIDSLAQCTVEIIALDATNRPRPEENLEDLVDYAKRKYPEILLMADVSTVSEAINAQKLGFDLVGTTLCGYTFDTKNQTVDQNDFAFLKNVISHVDLPVIAEGRINTPNKAKKALNLGAHSVVVGGAITRPKQITQLFVKTMSE